MIVCGVTERGGRTGKRKPSNERSVPPFIYFRSGAFFRGKGSAPWRLIGCDFGMGKAVG